MTCCHLCDLVSAAFPAATYAAAATCRSPPADTCQKAALARYCIRPVSQYAMARTQRYKLVLRDDGKGASELYDLPPIPPSAPTRRTTSNTSA